MILRIRVPRSQNSIPHVPFVTGILLMFAKQKTVKQYCVLFKQLYEIGPWCQRVGLHPGNDTEQDNNSP